MAAQAMGITVRDQEDWSTLLNSESDLGYAGFRLVETKKINVLLVGRSQAGKSTIVDSLVKPTHGVTATGLSVTKDPAFRTLVLTYKDELYQINFLDTPGLREVRSTMAEMRTDEDLLKLMVKCIEESITTINAVCLVSAAGKTALTDVEPFKFLIDFLGPEFAENTMMVLTHCDSFPQDKLDEFENVIQVTEVTKPIYEYCKLGFCRYGALSSDSVRNFDEELRPAMLKSTLKKTERFRADFLTRLISCAHKAKQIALLEHIVRMTENRQQDMILEVAKAIKRDPGNDKVLSVLQQKQAEAEEKLAREHAEEIRKLREAVQGAQFSSDVKVAEDDVTFEKAQTDEQVVLKRIVANHEEKMKKMRLLHKKEKEELERNIKKWATDGAKCSVM